MYLAFSMLTIPQLFENSVKRYSANPLIYEKVNGNYKEISYQEAQNKVYNFSCGLMNLGIEKEDRVALISEGRSEWLIAELAILYSGAIAVPLSTKINEHADLMFRIKHSGCRYIIVSGQQLDKVRKIIPELETVEKVIVLDDTRQMNENEATYFSVYSDGEASLEKQKPELIRRWTSLHSNDLANISYTSGTTADPKGIMLTHRNYTANTEQANSLFDVPSWYTTLLIISWDHSFAHTVGLYVMIKNGGSFAVVEQGRSPMETLRNIPKNIKEIKPVFQLSVPALARSFKKNIEAGIRAKGNEQKNFLIMR